MAGRPLPAFTSRRTKSPFPPLQTQPKRSHRVTRSQSRELSDSDIERKLKHDTRRKGTTTRQGEGRSKPKNGTGRLQDLPEVDENSQINYPTLPQQGTQHVAQVPRSTDVTRRSSGQPAKSPGGTSTFSGTTARISGSGQELSATSAEDMMDALKDLSDASSKILGLLVPREVSEASVHNIQGQLSDLKSRGTRQLQRHIPNFEAQRNVYGGDRFINAPASVRAVLKVSKLQDVRSGPWRMDPILYQANLATLLTVFLAQSGENIEHATNELDKVFPRPFLQLFVDKTAVGGVADGSALLSETFQVAVELRTYFFIDCAKRLHHTQGFDPDEVLTQVFYNHNDTLRGWNVAELRSEEINKNRTFKTTIIDRLDHLRETFSDEAPLIDLESLERSFPRFRLTTAVTWWSQLRVREVELQLRRLEGAVGIVRAIQSTGTGDGQMSLGTSDIDARRIALNYEQPSDTSQLDSDRLQAPKDKDAAKEAVLSKPYTFNSPKALPLAVSRLKKREASKRLSEVSAEPATARRAEPTAAIPPFAPAPMQTMDVGPSGTPPSWQPAIDDEDDDREPFIPDNTNAKSKGNRRAEAERIVRTFKNMEAESNKENVPVESTGPPPQVTGPSPRAKSPRMKRRLIDPQPHPERLEWNSQESESMPIRGQQSPISSTKRPKHHRQEDDNNSAGEDFQEDTRRIAPPRRSNVPVRSNQSIASTRSPSKRPQEPRQSRPNTQFLDLVRAVETHNNADPPMPSQVEMHQQVNSIAKRKTAMRPKKVQTRTPWSQQETDRLLDLIALHGISWSLLKKMDEGHVDGEVLDRRDQINLKDKARNIKMDFLKTGVPLPMNFNLIPLGKGLEQKLADIGVRYDPITGDRENAPLLDQGSDDSE